MKTLFITSIVAIALTSNAIAKDWAWFHGDIGMASPFVSLGSPKNNVTKNNATKRTVAKSKTTARQSVVARKSKSARPRLTSR